MEARELALRIVRGRTLEEKLDPAPISLCDEDPGPPLRMSEPGRPPDLRFATDRLPSVPALHGFRDPEQRPRIVHAFANHELQAVELFAWALLAFPRAPASFRRGLLHILADEQRHTRMYRARLRRWGLDLGSFPVSGYFWTKVEQIVSPAHFVCAMSLTFENANLDHTLDYSAVARKAGDDDTAAILERIHRDEIEHVRFGWTWLRHFKAEDQSMWDAYCSLLEWPLRGALARGRVFHPEGREKAGLDPDFIRRLRESDRTEGRPAPGSR